MKKLTFKKLLSGHYDTGKCLKRDDMLLDAMQELGWFPYSSPYSKRIKRIETNNPGSINYRWAEERSPEWKEDIRTSLKMLGRI